MTLIKTALPDAAAAAFMDEMLHRQANEYAAALATLRIMKARSGCENALLEQAIDRIEAQVALQRLLLDRPAEDPMQRSIERMCELLLRSRSAGDTFAIAYKGSHVRVPAPLRRPILLAGYELINNALKHCDAKENPIAVTFSNPPNHLCLVVTNASRETDPAVNRSSGLDIVHAIAAHHGGKLVRKPLKGIVEISIVFTAPTTHFGLKQDEHRKELPR